MTGVVAFDRGAAEREAKAMFSNQALHRSAAAMAGCHERALDYIRLAPVLVLASNAGKTGTAAYNAAYRAHQPMMSVCQRGGKLRDVMRFYGLPLQLRALHANVLHPKRWVVVYRLGRVNPSTLAQIIPTKRKDQEAWLYSLTVWCEHLKRRCQNPWLQFDWAASALRSLSRSQAGLAETVADLALEASRSQPRDDVVFDTRWTFDQAHAAAERWHALLGRRRAEQKVASGLGIGFSDTVEYAPFDNDPVVVDGFEMVPLRSCEELYLEGVAMRHCVASYSAQVMSGRIRIFSVRQSGRRVATLEVGQRRFGDLTPGSWKPVQIKGPCNSRPVAGVQAAAIQFCQDAAERKAAPLSLRDVFPDVGASFSGEAA